MRRSQTYLNARVDWILNTLKNNGSITIDEIVREFSVSSSTARKQLNTLHEQGLLTRTHGGAASNLPADHQKVSLIKEKEAIARLARSKVRDGSIIAVGAGTTTFFFSKLLHDVKGLTVVTNSLLVANELRDDVDIEVRICGGMLKHSSCAVIGPQAEAFFRNVYVDQSFVGADAVCIGYGITSKNVYESFSERGIVTCSKEVIVLADHTKIGTNACVDRLASFDEIRCIITDGQVNNTVVEKIREMNVEVLIAE